MTLEDTGYILQAAAWVQTEISDPNKGVSVAPM